MTLSPLNPSGRRQILPQTESKSQQSCHKQQGFRTVPENTANRKHSNQVSAAYEPTKRVRSVEISQHESVRRGRVPNTKE